MKATFVLSFLGLAAFALATPVADVDALTAANVDSPLAARACTSAGKTTCRAQCSNIADHACSAGCTGTCQTSCRNAVYTRCSACCNRNCLTCN
ncbi:hypothetical protein ACLOAV_008990 [Pseudogymnoascus australis]